MFGVAVGGPKPLTEAQREVVRRRVFKGADQVYWSIRGVSSFADPRHACSTQEAN